MQHCNPLLAAATALIVPLLASGANLILNGSFEQGPSIPAGSSFRTLHNGSTAITGWTVTRSTIDYIGPGWQASDGIRAIDMDGAFSAGRIQQTFATVTGQQYVGSFDLAGNPEGAPRVKTVRVAVDGFSQDYSFDTIGQSRSNLHWQRINFTFVASGATATLSFTSLSPSNNSWGALIDNVSVDADSTGPITSNVLTDPQSPVSASDAVIITATVDDTTTGNSHVASATCELTNISTDPPLLISCNPVTADDGSFDAPTEDVTATIPAGALMPGVYDLCVDGTDALGNVGTDTCSLFVVYDPDEGFVTGGGWIQSPAGALVSFPEATGRANFGFVSKYKRGANIPTGQTEFRFKAGAFNFHSSSYEWLVISGPLAQYKGSGTVNGGGEFGFLLTARDSAVNGGTDADTFRIKIWDSGNDVLVYDNGVSLPVDGGGITIHTR